MNRSPRRHDPRRDPSPRMYDRRRDASPRGGGPPGRYDNRNQVDPSPRRYDNRSPPRRFDKRRDDVRGERPGGAGRSFWSSGPRDLDRDTWRRDPASYTSPPPPPPRQNSGGGYYDRSRGGGDRMERGRSPTSRSPRRDRTPSPGGGGYNRRYKDYPAGGRGGYSGRGRGRGRMPSRESPRNGYGRPSNGSGVYYGPGRGSGTGYYGGIGSDVSSSAHYAAPPVVDTTRFNTGEALQLFAQRWQAVSNDLHNDSIPEGQKPQVYKAEAGKTVWGISKLPLQASVSDFLGELQKALARGREEEVQN